MKRLHWLPIIVVVAVAACKKDSKVQGPSLTTTSVTAITATSVITGGTITNNGGSTITKSGIAWALHTNPTVADSITSDGTTSGSFTTSLTNLNANTAYFIRAYAINSVSTGYGNVDSFVTAKGLATIKTTAISDIAPLTAKSGAAITNDGGTAVTARGICWSTAPHPTTDNFKTIAGTGMGTSTDTLTDLASQTVYYVRAYATNSYGTAYGNELSFSAASANTITDIDGNVYPYIQLGTQYWMTTNLRATHFQNGDAITNGLNNYNWSASVTGAYTYPNGDIATNEKYGKLYDAYAVNDSRNVCPIGWHIPTDQEWQAVEFFEGMTPADTLPANRGDRGAIAPKLVMGGASGLNLNYAGILYPDDGGYYFFGTQGWYQSSTSGGNDITYGTFLGNWYRLIDSTNAAPVNRDMLNVAGSVRCIKN